MKKIVSVCLALAMVTSVFTASVIFSKAAAPAEIMLLDCDAITGTVNDGFAGGMALDTENKAQGSGSIGGTSWGGANVSGDFSAPIDASAIGFQNGAVSISLYVNDKMADKIMNGRAGGTPSWFELSSTAGNPDLNAFEWDLAKFAPEGGYVADAWNTVILPFYQGKVDDNQKVDLSSLKNMRLALALTYGVGENTFRIDDIKIVNLADQYVNEGIVYKVGFDGNNILHGLLDEGNRKTGNASLMFGTLGENKQTTFGADWKLFSGNPDNIMSDIVDMGEGATGKNVIATMWVDLEHKDKMGDLNWELSSDGGSDYGEYEFRFKMDKLAEGWNLITFKFDPNAVTADDPYELVITEAPENGAPVTPDLRHIDYSRFYTTVATTGEAYVRLDELYFIRQDKIDGIPYAETTSVDFVKSENKDLVLPINMNNAVIDNVKLGTTTLEQADYTVTANILTIKKEAFSDLTANTTIEVNFTNGEKIIFNVKYIATPDTSSSKPVDSSSKADNEIPPTGDNTMAVVIVILALAATSMLVVKKRAK